MTSFDELTTQQKRILAGVGAAVVVVGLGLGAVALGSSGDGGGDGGASTSSSLAGGSSTSSSLGASSSSSSSSSTSSSATSSTSSSSSSSTATTAATTSTTRATTTTATTAAPTTSSSTTAPPTSADLHALASSSDGGRTIVVTIENGGPTDAADLSIDVGLGDQAGPVTTSGESGGLECAVDGAAVHCSQGRTGIGGIVARVTITTATAPTCGSGFSVVASSSTPDPAPANNATACYSAR